MFFCFVNALWQRQGYFLRSSATRITKNRPSPARPKARTKKPSSPAGSSRGINRLSKDSSKFEEMRAPILRKQEEGASSHHTFSEREDECMRILNRLSRELGISVEAYVRAREILATPVRALVFVFMVQSLQRYWVSSVTKDSVGFWEVFENRSLLPSAAPWCPWPGLPPPFPFPAAPSLLFPFLSLAGISGCF